MDYSKLSDFEINKRVGDIAMNGTWHVAPSHPDNKTSGWMYGSNGIETKPLPDYCNNAAAAWPIIFENGISVVRDCDEWVAFAGVESQHGGPDYFSHCYQKAPEAPLRAAMIVYFMMKEGEGVTR